MLTGATRLAAVIGRPIAHSLSPAIHNAAFAAAGLDWVFLAFDAGQGEGAAAIAGAKTLGLVGLSVTMPLKEAAAAAADRLTPEAAALGAVNTLYRDGGDFVGDNTDGRGFIDALRLDAGWSPAGRTAMVVGAGGAARAVTLALRHAGAADVAVVARDPAKAAAAAALAGGSARAGRPEEAGGLDLVVNATPLGMAGMPPRGHDLLGDVSRHLRGEGQLVADLVYHPLATDFLAGASERGAATLTGLPMLVHQAARAFERWTGFEAPRDVMSAAATAAIQGRPGGATPPERVVP